MLDVKRGQANALTEALKGYEKAREEGALLLVTYETVTDYLFILQSAARTLSPFRQNVRIGVAA